MKIWMIGARGTIATTAAIGTVAVQKGLMPLEGVLTDTPPFQDLGLAGIDEISFGGCDLQPGAFWEGAMHSSTAVGGFSPALLQEVAPEFSSIHITRGILRGAGPAVQALAGDSAGEYAREHAQDAVERISKDLRTFAGSDDAVMINLASTEPLPDPSTYGWTLADFERALEEDDPRLPASSLYAYAALRSGLPYINFTPSTGAALPALLELAEQVGLPLAGRDGKTGETLVKTALAPMFAIRNLTVEGWYGANILGNTDGQVLEHEDNKASKVASKKGVLEQCLGYAPQGQVRIDYFPPLLDNKVAWDFIQFRGWGGHRMRMQFTWEGTDAILAAPLVIDLARLVQLARQRGESGPVPAMALFFKTPEGTPEMNLHRQYEMLLEWTRAGVQEESGEPEALADTLTR